MMGNRSYLFFFYLFLFITFLREEEKNIFLKLYEINDSYREAGREKQKKSSILSEGYDNTTIYCASRDNIEL